jgi:hypothetical protein
MKSNQIPNTQARQSVVAGNATLTFRNSETGNRFTFKVVKPDRKDPNCPHFVKVLTGSDNENDFTFLGTIFTDGNYRHGRKSRITRDAQSAKVFEWIWRNIDDLPEILEVWHEGRCLRCGRKLTVPESIESGYGPECIKSVLN